MYVCGLVREGVVIVVGGRAKMMTGRDIITAEGSGGVVMVCRDQGGGNGV